MHAVLGRGTGYGSWATVDVRLGWLCELGRNVGPRSRRARTQVATARLI